MKGLVRNRFFFSLSLMCIKLQSKLKCTLVEIFHLLQQNTHSYKLQSQSVTAKHQYLGRVSVVSCILWATFLKSDNLQYNMLGRWGNGTSVWCYKYYVFHNFMQNSLQNHFNLFFYFSYNFADIKIKNFQCPKSKPVTHCLIFKT